MAHPQHNWSHERVIVTGGAGFLGRSVVCALAGRGVPLARVKVPRSRGFDLTQPGACSRLLREARDVVGGEPTMIIHCAGFVGGLGANRAFPARFFHDNLLMGTNLVEAARREGLLDRGDHSLKFVQVSTMCAYPADAPLPYREESLFTGLPDADIASYGIAKLALLQMLRAYRAQHGLRAAYVIPVNLFGPGDNIADEKNSHVAGALMRRFVEAAARGDKEVVCWGTGAPTRDFVYVDDAAEGLLRAAEVIDDCTPVNIASGAETSIRDLATLIARLAGFSGRIVWDASKGDGVSRRCLDITRARTLLGWSPRTSLEDGLRRTIEWYRGTLKH